LGAPVVVDQPEPPVGPVGPGALALPRPRGERDADGPFVYKPRRGFHGTGHLLSNATDGIGRTAIATASIKVARRG
jgi:hypothetical protein